MAIRRNIELLEFILRKTVVKLVLSNYSLFDILNTKSYSISLKERIHL